MSWHACLLAFSERYPALLPTATRQSLLDGLPPCRRYYLVVQSNPPETGEDASRTFTLTVGPAPPQSEPAAATADHDSEEAAEGGAASAAGEQGQDLCRTQAPAVCNDSAACRDG